MNLFGIEIKFREKNNPGYVNKENCDRTHDLLEKSLDSRFTSLMKHIDTRIEDLKFWLRDNK